MSQYMSIGKVSKLKNVSIKSLRYYDQIGILKPAFVNTETNYRYYTESQLYLLDAITVCIKLGIPLKDLNNYVNNDSINLQKLLYDGKILAEQKIMEIHNCLGTLQETLQKMGSSVTGMARIPESRSGILLPDGFYQKMPSHRTTGCRGHTEILRAAHPETVRHRAADRHHSLLPFGHTA